MNLITDAWIPVMRSDGRDIIRPWQIAEIDNPVLEINAPRPDFQGALYQLLIGLLQSFFAPENEDAWLNYWEKPPTSKDVRNSLEKVSVAFELFNNKGPAFMQDYDMVDGDTKSVAGLLIDAPGENAIKKNTDHFVKRDRVSVLCPACAATALFTLQINAPSGGTGHRVGLRGGGPLTTLLLSGNNNDTLWKKIWLNVLNKEELPSSGNYDSSVLPWLDQARLSAKGADITMPADVDALQMYWGMPRRIRLEKSEDGGICDICCEQTATVCKAYRTKNHGINYGGPWVHPLTPYRFDKKKKKIPLSQKGQKGGLGYRHWLGLTFQDNDTGYKAATIVEFFNNERCYNVSEIRSAGLWCFGYDMDKMKARCWYDVHFPVLAVSRDQRDNLIDWAGELIRAAREVVKILRVAGKSAWFRRQENIKGDMIKIDQQFWEATESDFYLILEKLTILPAGTRVAPPEIYVDWFNLLKKTVFHIFDRNCFDSIPEDLDLKRIVAAKQELGKKFYANRTIKALIRQSV